MVCTLLQSSLLRCILGDSCGLPCNNVRVADYRAGVTKQFFKRHVLHQARDVVALWAKPQKPVLQGQKTKQLQDRRSDLPSLVPAPANLAVRKHVNASR